MMLVLVKQHISFVLISFFSIPVQNEWRREMKLEHL
jgi:hypothetical protein